MSAPRNLPLTAAALLVSGVLHRHTSVRGDTAPDLHPLVRRFLHQLPVDARERFAGWCAETVLVSDRLYEAEGEAPGSLSAAAARAHLWDGQISVVWIREPGDPLHASPYPSCRSCVALMEWFGLSATTSPPTEPAGDHERVDEARVRRWVLELSAYASPAGQRHVVVPAAIDAFRRVGGLRRTPNGPGEQVAASGFVVDPIRALASVDTLANLGEAIGSRLTPLGVENDGTGLLAIDEQARVFVLDPTAEWFLGNGVDDALETLLAGRTPARVGEDGRWT